MRGGSGEASRLCQQESLRAGEELVVVHAGTKRFCCFTIHKVQGNPSFFEGLNKT